MYLEIVKKILDSDEFNVHLERLKNSELECHRAVASLFTTSVNGFNWRTVIRMLYEMCFLQRLPLRYRVLLVQHTTIRIPRELIPPALLESEIATLVTEIDSEDLKRLCEQKRFNTAWYVASHPNISWEEALSVIDTKLTGAYAVARCERYVYATARLYAAIMKGRVLDVIEETTAEVYAENRLWGFFDPVTEEVIRRVLERGGTK